MGDRHAKKQIVTNLDDNIIEGIFRDPALNTVSGKDIPAYPIDHSFQAVMLGLIDSLLVSGSLFAGYCVFDFASREVTTMLLVLNVAVVIGLTVLFQYFHLNESQHSLGKAFLIGLSLWIMNQLIFLNFGDSAWTDSLMLTSLISAGCFTSAWSHFHLTQPLHESNPKSVYFRLEKGLKRGFDLVMGTLGLIVMTPFMLCITAAIMLESNGSPFFGQTRVGIREQKFQMWKFRSMVKDAHKKHRQSLPVLFKQSDDPRITKVGWVIRKLSIDELPQLWNIITGEMSLVGPRPPIETEFTMMNWYHRRKFEVTPGLTGLWQITGRVNNERDFNSVAGYDTRYIDTWSLMLDLEILFKTLPVVLLQKGAY